MMPIDLVIGMRRCFVEVSGIVIKRGYYEKICD